jgi:uncharacterized protein (TIGR02594 family)
MQPESTQYRSTALLNIRNAPTSSSNALGRLNVDDVIEMISESEDGKWIKFLYNGVEAWSSKKYLKKVPYIPPLGEDFPWMTIAEGEKGISQIDGSEHNPRILEYLRSTTVGKRAASEDETSWCSAFVNWCLDQAVYERTKSAVARSWLSWGQAIEIPRRGCIVVFTREKNYGHVGFYLEETETHIKILGGNQTNPETGKSEVCEKFFPKSDLLGYRIPK